MPRQSVCSEGDAPQGSWRKPKCSRQADKTPWEWYDTPVASGLDDESLSASFFSRFFQAVCINELMLRRSDVILSPRVQTKAPIIIMVVVAQLCMPRARGHPVSPRAILGRSPLQARTTGTQRGMTRCRAREGISCGDAAPPLTIHLPPPTHPPFQLPFAHPIRWIPGCDAQGPNFFYPVATDPGRGRLHISGLSAAHLDWPRCSGSGAVCCRASSSIIGSSIVSERQSQRGLRNNNKEGSVRTDQSHGRGKYE